MFIGYFSFKEVFGIQTTAPYFFVSIDVVYIIKNNTCYQHLFCGMCSLNVGIKAKHTVVFLPYDFSLKIIFIGTRASETVHPAGLL